MAPEMLKKNPSLGDYKASLIRDRALAHYPALEGWGEPRAGRPLSWANLMWIESEIMIKTMLDLMRDHSVPSLSVHDSLIVPASKADLAAGRISLRFWGPLEAEPLLIIHRPELAALRSEPEEAREQRRNREQGEGRTVQEW
jgi:hypothetical protein